MGCACSISTNTYLRISASRNPRSPNPASIGMFNVFTMKTDAYSDWFWAVIFLAFRQVVH